MYNVETVGHTHRHISLFPLSIINQSKYQNDANSEITLTFNRLTKQHSCPYAHPTVRQVSVNRLGQEVSV